jgi:hypothetical protein
MTLNDDDTLETCAVCGAATDPAVDRAYVVDETLVLCLACASERGGVYDEEEDRWREAPRIDDLLPVASLGP